MNIRLTSFVFALFICVSYTDRVDENDGGFGSFESHIDPPTLTTSQQLGNTFQTPHVIQVTEGCRCDGATGSQTSVQCQCSGPLVTPEGIRNITGPAWIDDPSRVVKLILTDCELYELTPGIFDSFSGLTYLRISDCNQLGHIAEGTFDVLKKLNILIIQQCPKLKHIGPGVLGTFPHLMELVIKQSGLESVPVLSSFKTNGKQIPDIDLDTNNIQEVEAYSFKGVRLRQLRLDNNNIRIIKNHAFSGAKISTLSIKHNRKLEIMEEDSLAGIEHLTRLHLSGTRIRSLPVSGMQNIEELELEELPTLKQLPSVFKFERIKTAKLTFKFHCCAFENPEKASPAEFEAQMNKLRQKQKELCENNTPTTLETFTESTMGRFIQKVRRSISPLQGIDFVQGFGFGKIDNNGSIPLITSSAAPTLGHEIWKKDEVSLQDLDTVCMNQTAVQVHRITTCLPEQDSYSPCEDVMGYQLLRAAVWFVSITALLGNLTVIVVLLSSTFKMNVSKFLMCNLAFADFCMGLYLLLLAAIDAHTLGEYFNYAIAWQWEGGCQIAGFLTVFASELSIFTLTVITIERWCAITYALHLNKRLKLGLAKKVMVIGWGFAIIMATLPLIGVSSYSKTSICLPMDVGTVWGLCYVITLLIITMVAFVIICCCYTKMYCSIRGHESTASSGDATVAKRMALLVFTDFACWAPIAFFGLTAASSSPLIGISESKILLVFFYPLNSCANPFLYAIMTKQFRRDFFILLSKYGICTERALRHKSEGYSQNHPSRTNYSVNYQTNRNTSNGTVLAFMSRGSKSSIKYEPEQMNCPNPGKSSPTDEKEAKKLSVVREVSTGSNKDPDTVNLITTNEAAADCSTSQENIELLSIEDGKSKVKSMQLDYKKGSTLLDGSSQDEILHEKV